MSFEDKNTTTETFLDDDEHFYPVVGETEADQDVDHAVVIDSNPPSVAEEDSVEEADQEEGEKEKENEEAPISTIGEAMLIDSLIKSLKKDHEVAAVYNYIITEAAPVAPGVVAGMIDKIDELLPTLTNVEEGFLLSLKAVGLDLNDHRANNPFYELKRKFYALKYLLEGHLK